MIKLPNPWIPEFEAAASDPAAASTPCPPAAGPISDGQDVPAQMQESSDRGPLHDDATSGDTMQESRPAHPATAPSEDGTDHIHEIFHFASKQIADDYRDWVLTQEDDDLYEALKAADQANTRDIPIPDERALMGEIEWMPLFLRRTA